MRSNRTMSRDDFERYPEMRSAASRIMWAMEQLRSRQLVYSTWVGTINEEHIPNTILNKGPGYEPLPWFSDDPNIPWFTLWEYCWNLTNSGLLEETESKRVLSLGGSSSAFDALLAMLGHKIVVIERRPHTARNTRKNAAVMGWDVEVLDGDIADMRSLVNGMPLFDYCVSINVLFLSGDEAQQEVRDGLADVVKVGGVHSFTFDVFNPNPKRFLADPIAHFNVRGFEPDPGGFVDNGERHHFFYPEPDKGRYTAGGLRQVRVR